MGMANPMPIEPPPSKVAMAVFTPMTSPRALTSGPPELPGLIEASVCNADCRLPPIRTDRSTALTMPEVTVPDSPSGDPTASTCSPTRTPAELPSVSARNAAPSSTRNTARSFSGSAPTTSAANRRPSGPVTNTVAEPASRMWLLVSTCRWSSMRNPVPEALPARTDTTPCRTWSATATRSPGVRAGLGPGRGSEGVATPPGSPAYQPASPPTPAETPTTSNPAISNRGTTPRESRSRPPRVSRSDPASCGFVSASPAPGDRESRVRKESTRDSRGSVGGVRKSGPFRGPKPFVCKAFSYGSLENHSRDVPAVARPKNRPSPMKR